MRTVVFSEFGNNISLSYRNTI
uniref:DUF3124 domain-containing protein n=1 Tax=Heterorhabditis bacteriophora TaxID=37862 RepID=A0A1I7WDQ7_HETBA